MTRLTRLCIAVFAWATLFCGFLPAATAAGLVPFALACEYKTRPLVIDTPHPRLFWKLSGAGRSRKQTAYQIQVASSLAVLAKNRGDLWDSGKVASSRTIQIPYAGKPLASFAPAYWKVRVWDETETVSRWSAPAEWAMGLLKKGDWQTQWIAAPVSLEAKAARMDRAQWIWHAADGANPPAAKRWLRGTFILPDGAKTIGATLIISADNAYSVSLNGNAAHRGPRQTDSWRTYQAFAVARELRPGKNMVLIEAENGEAGPAGVLARLTITTRTQTVSLATSTSWETAEKAGGPYAPARVIGEYGAAPWGRIASEAGSDRTPPSHFRKDFTLTKPVKRAVLYATALGVYELSLNGKRVGSDVLSPGWTDFNKRAHYLAYDVTKQLRPKNNALGAILGDGWYASYVAFTGRHHFYGGDPKLCVQLRVEYTDGAIKTWKTDKTWQTKTGPVAYADMLMGCRTDTRREMPGWNTFGFSEPGWKPATVQTAPKIVIQAQPNEPIRTQKILPARTRTIPKPGVFIYNIGQNMSGWARITIKNAAPNQTLTVRYGERLNPDGTLYTTNLRTARATDTFVLRGSTQVLEPKFTFHGFQYVEITGLKTPPSVQNVAGVAVSSDLAPALTFDSDNPLLNRLMQNIGWGWLGNSLDVPTDCPQRDERAGWTGDAQVFAKTAMLYRNSAPFFTKWLQDVSDGQRSDGSYPDTAPSIIGGGNAAWEDVGVICTYRMWEMYGDTALIKKQWPELSRFMAHLAAVSPNQIRPAGEFGDWLLLRGPQKSPILGTAYYFRSAHLMAQMADATGKPADAQKYRTLAAKIRTAFQSRFVSPEGRVAETNGTGEESQTFYALALEWDLLPDAKRAFAASRLQALIDKQNGHLATGFIGTPLLLPALASVGNAQESSSLLLNETYPSWLYQVKMGATTTWERWDGWTPQKGFQTPVMNSFNHYWLGCVGEWVVTGVVGLDTSGPGWQKITVRPHTEGMLKHASAAYESLCGRVETGWTKHRDGTLEITLNVPANVSATVYVPAQNAAQVKESGVSAASAKGVRFVRQEKNAAVFEVSSGRYRFVAAP